MKKEHSCVKMQISNRTSRFRTPAFVLILLTAFGAKVNAENLVHVGRIDPVGIKLYADKDSISRRADISQIKAIVIPDPTKKNAETLQMAFDCSEKTYSTSETPSANIEKSMVWQKSSEKFSVSSEAVKNIFNIACKRAYEFWR